MTASRANYWFPRHTLHLVTPLHIFTHESGDYTDIVRAPRCLLSRFARASTQPWCGSVELTFQL